MFGGSESAAISRLDRLIAIVVEEYTKSSPYELMMITLFLIFLLLGCIGVSYLDLQCSFDVSYPIANTNDGKFPMLDPCSRASHATNMQQTCNKLLRDSEGHYLSRV